MRLLAILISISLPLYGGSITWSNVALNGSPLPGFTGWNIGIGDQLYGRTIWFVGTTGTSSIFATDVYELDTTVTPAVWSHIAGSANPTERCDLDTVGYPSSRHPYGNQVWDTKRNAWWVWGGLNAACGSGSQIDRSGAAVTRRSGAYEFATNGSWIGQTCKINGVTYTVQSVTDASNLVLSGSPGGSDTNQAMTMTLGTNGPSIIRAMWMMQVASTPSAATFTKMSPANPLYNSESSAAYLETADAIFSFGNDYNSVAHVYCRTTENPTPGTLTAAQTAVGCSAADDWTNITSSLTCTGADCITNGAGNGMPPSVSVMGLVYHSGLGLVIGYGGRSQAGGANTYNFTWSYTPTTKAWKELCTSGCTPPPVEPTPGAHGSDGVPALGIDPRTNLIHYHASAGSGAPADYTFDATAGSTGVWTTDTTTGTGTSYPAAPAWDTGSGSLITWDGNGQGTGGTPAIRKGLVPAGAAPALTVSGKATLAGKVN